MNLQDNDFILFDVPEQFAQDATLLQSRWMALQRQAHPDQFAAQGDAAQRLAMQWSVRINEAYQRLKSPRHRAAYLCELHGVDIAAHDNTAMPGEFLIQQMTMREALEEAVSLDALEKIEQEVLQLKTQALEACQQLIDDHQDYRLASIQVRALMFIEKFENDVHACMDALD